MRLILLIISILFVVSCNFKKETHVAKFNERYPSFFDIKYDSIVLQNKDNKTNKLDYSFIEKCVGESDITRAKFIVESNLLFYKAEKIIKTIGVNKNGFFIKYEGTTFRMQCKL